MRKVVNVICPDTGRNITDLVNAAAERYGFDPVGFLGGLVAESGLKEAVIRKRTWPDWSAGLAQPTLKWYGYLVPGVMLDPGSKIAQPTEANWQLFVACFSDAERSIEFAAPRYAERLIAWGTPEEAWVRWNKPSTGLPPNEPRRLHYRASIAAAEKYITEEAPPMTIVDQRGQLPTFGGARYDTRSLSRVRHCVIHYTFGPASQSVREIAAYQTSAAAAGQTGTGQPFPAIAYHYLVDGNGTVHRCHDLTVETWHKPGKNPISYAVCYTGNTNPSVAQRAGIAIAIHDAETILGRTVPIEGHKDGYSTSCPGPGWPAWKVDVESRLDELRAKAAPTPPTALTDALTFFTSLRGVLVTDLGQSWATEMDAKVLQPLRRGDAVAAEQYAAALTDYLGAELPNRFRDLGQQVAEQRDRLRAVK